MSVENWPLDLMICGVRDGLGKLKSSFDGRKGRKKRGAHVMSKETFQRPGWIAGNICPDTDLLLLLAKKHGMLRLNLCGENGNVGPYLCRHHLWLQNKPIPIL